MRFRRISQRAADSFCLLSGWTPCTASKQQAERACKKIRKKDVKDKKAFEREVHPPSQDMGIGDSTMRITLFCFCRQLF